jgi:hypothetical protein
MDNDWQDRQRRRWMRPNAHLYIQPDAARWLQPNQRLWQKPTYHEQKYSADQPRVPAGNSDGGQWTVVSSGGGISIAVPAFSGFDGGDGGGGTDAGTNTGVDSAIALPEVVVTADNGAGDGSNDQKPVQLAGDIPTGDPPEIPEERPPTSPARTAALKAVARLLGPMAIVAEIAQFGAWFTSNAALIQSYNDPPKSLEELQQAVSTPAPGYDKHHIVEQTQAADDGFARDVIDSPDNLALVPRLKHQEITGWYQTPNPDYDWETPREYLSGRNWAVRRSVGLRAMRIFGVLKP